jgi:hypothetical protein
MKPNVIGPRPISFVPWCVSLGELPEKKKKEEMKGWLKLEVKNRRACVHLFRVVFIIFCFFIQIHSN